MHRARLRGHRSRFHKITGKHQRGQQKADSRCTQGRNVLAQSLRRDPSGAPHNAQRGESRQCFGKKNISHHTVHRKRKGLRAKRNPSLTLALRPITAVRGLLHHHRSHRPDHGHGCDAAGAAALRDHQDHRRMPACEPLRLQDRVYHPRD